MGDRKKTLGDRARDLLDAVGAWLDEVLPAPVPTPVPVPVPVRVRPRR